MHFSYVWKCSLVFIITVICLASTSDIRSITPWMVNIQKYNLVGNSQGYHYHCAGVLLQSIFPLILMSDKCLSTFPANSQMVFFAGGQNKRIINYTYIQIQKLLPTSHKTKTYYQTQTFFQPPIKKTNYVDFIRPCKAEHCELDAIGYQFGWSSIDVQMVQYNFSNSSQLCLEANELNDKFCTYHDCALFYKGNLGGEFLTKIHGGITYLMGFWDYDACDKNIRVFTRLKEVGWV